MIRRLNVLLMATSLLALVGVYVVKYHTEEIAAELAAIQQNVSRQQGELSLLKADWAYLNQPAHIAPIVERHAETLGLAPVQQAQFGGFDDLPMRPNEPDGAALDALFEALEQGYDPIAELIMGTEP